MSLKRIIVCDSGLGGLDIAEKFFLPFSGVKDPGKVEGYEVFYFNAFPDSATGYNDLPSEKAQEEVFRCALEGMKKFSPDQCLIACNTLSIIYDRLKQWYTPAFPVEGIVECAVKGMNSFMQERSASAQLLILGTLTTVGSAVYENGLLASGVEKERLFSLAVPGLARKLESGVETGDVQKLIREAAQKAALLLPCNTPETPLALGLCCTHYGFAAQALEKAFREATGRKEIYILNPNEWMCPQEMRGKGKSFSYHARIDFFPGSRENMKEYFLSRNIPCIPQTLEQAQKESDLFEFQAHYRNKELKI